MNTRAAVLAFAAVAAGSVLGGRSDAAVIPDAGGPSLVMGANGRGLFAYYDRIQGDLVVGRCVDAACLTVTTSVIDSAGDVGRYAAVAPVRGAMLGPVIVYEDSTNHALKLALCVDPACAAASIVVIAPDLGAGHGAAVAIGNDGFPLIAYLRQLDSEPAGSLVAAHCENAGCTSITTSTLRTARSGLGIDIGIGGDSRGAIVFTSSPGFLSTDVGYVHCADVACTALTPSPMEASSLLSSPDGGFDDAFHPSLAMGLDGLATYAAAFRVLIGGPSQAARIVHCQSYPCVPQSTQFVPAAYEPLDIAVGPDNLARLAVPQLNGPGLDLVRCLDASCTQSEVSCATALGRVPSLALDAAGEPLVAFQRGADLVVAPDGPCEPIVAITNGSASEGDSGAPVLSFAVDLGPAQATPVTVAYATADGTALAGTDYVAATGTITFPPGTTSGTIEVTLIPDALQEADETFALVLSNPSGAALADGQAVGTIVDDDALPFVSVHDCAVVEGDTGTTGCVFEARLTAPYPLDVTVEYATSPGTGLAGSDYLTQSGTLTFAPGTLSRTVSVSVVGDVSVEPDETFFLLLSNPVNAAPDDMSAVATIVDDDSAPLSDIELTHGSTLTADLAASPGPVADEDSYRLAQSPFASYEVLLDAVSGDAAPDVHLELLAADGSTLLQTGTPVGTGSASSLRFQNRLGAPLASQYIRVAGASCGTACGPDDTYRLRLYETTGSIARFNNSSSQVTILLLQNPTSEQIGAFIDFWDAGGSRVATTDVIVPPHGLFVVNTSTLVSLAGSSGSITITHSGPYGSLAGKAVALEPATGFSFDSPLAVRPR